MPEAPISRVRKFQLFIVDASLTVAGVTAVCGGLWSVYKENAALAATCMAAGLILLFAATLDRFEFLKGFGIEAKVRRLDDTLNKAEIALEKLRALGELTGATLISLSSNVGRLGGAPSVAEAKKLADDVSSTLRGLGSDDAKIRLAITPWLRTEVRDLCMASIVPINTILNAKAQEISLVPVSGESQDVVNARIKQRNDIQNYINNFYNEIGINTSPEEIMVVFRRQIEDCPFLSREEIDANLALAKPVLDEMNYLIANSTFRDINFWIARLPGRNEQ